MYGDLELSKKVICYLHLCFYFFYYADGPLNAIGCFVARYAVCNVMITLHFVERMDKLRGRQRERYEIL